MTAQQLFNKIEQKLANTLRNLPLIIGNEVVNFTLDNFNNQSWEGQQWQQRKPQHWGKPDDPKRALLVKTAKLKRSVRITLLLKDRVRVGVGGIDVPYAKAHNEGFRGLVEQTVEEHTRTVKFKKIKVKPFKRIIIQNIPKRQFIGTERQSIILSHRLKKVCNEELTKIFKNL